MSVFVQVPPATTATELIHVTWAGEWRPVLARFGAACAAMPPAEKVPQLQPGADGYEEFAGGGDTLTTWTLPAAAWDGQEALRAEMDALADEFFAWEPPASAVILTG